MVYGTTSHNATVEKVYKYHFYIYREPLKTLEKIVKTKKSRDYETAWII
jgi:hypothetical protein